MKGPAQSCESLAVVEIRILAGEILVVSERETREKPSQQLQERHQNLFVQEERAFVAVVLEILAQEQG